MSVKFKPTQIAMPLSANYGRWYAKMVPAGANTAADFGFCYIVTLLHVTLRSFSQCSLYSVIAEGISRECKTKRWQRHHIYLCSL